MYLVGTARCNIQRKHAEAAAAQPSLRYSLPGELTHYGVEATPGGPGVFVCWRGLGCVTAVHVHCQPAGRGPTCLPLTQPSFKPGCLHLTTHRCYCWRRATKKTEASLPRGELCCQESAAMRDNMDTGTVQGRNAYSLVSTSFQSCDTSRPCSLLVTVLASSSRREGLLGSGRCCSTSSSGSSTGRCAGRQTGTQAGRQSRAIHW